MSEWVLSIGSAPAWLQTRRPALKAAGYRMRSVWASGELSQALEKRRYAVVLIGPLSASRRLDLLHRVRAKAPDAAVVLLYDSDIPHPAGAGATLSTTATPEELVKTVKHLAAQRRHTVP